MRHENQGEIFPTDILPGTVVLLKKVKPGFFATGAKSRERGAKSAEHRAESDIWEF
jgi:hypothetical protein